MWLPPLAVIAERCTENLREENGCRDFSDVNERKEVQSEVYPRIMGLQLFFN